MVQNPLSPTPAAPVDLSSNVDSTPDKETLLNLLNAEIILLSQQQSNTGWTSWALLGALGGILWLMLGQWESGWPQGDLWALCFVSLTLCRFLVVLFVNVFQARTSRPAGQ